MGHYIIKLDGLYLNWSSVVDAPIGYGLTREEGLAKWTDDVNSREHIEECLRQADAGGVIGDDGVTASQLLEHNRAGLGESCLTREQIIAHYCRAKREWWLGGKVGQPPITPMGHEHTYTEDYDPDSCEEAIAKAKGAPAA